MQDSANLRSLARSSHNNAKQTAFDPLRGSPVIRENFLGIGSNRGLRRQETELERRSSAKKKAVIKMNRMTKRQGLKKRENGMVVKNPKKKMTAMTTIN